MRIILKTPEGAEFECVKPYHDAPYVDVPGIPCSSCKRPLQAKAREAREVSPDVYEGPAFCDACSHPVGILRVEIASIFGKEEDDRVLSGPWKVY